MKKLYLDDVRATPAGFVGVRNYKEFISYIRNFGLPQYISFDHDLGEENTGYDCAKFLVEYCLDHRRRLPAWHVHSQNPVGKENIERLLQNFQRVSR